jgi:uncharacterized protein (DUF427 family)
MVKAIINGTVVTGSSDTVFVEGNHYFPPEAIKVNLSISELRKTASPWQRVGVLYLHT